jgi:hypothetical protein
MKFKSVVYFTLIILFFSCSKYKSANSALVSGNFNEAFKQSIEAYSKNPSNKNAEKYMPIIFEAYKKGQEADEARIKELQNVDSPHKYRELYELLTNLQIRQNDIKGVDDKVVNGIKYNFKTKDYSKAYNTVKNKYAKYLYDEAVTWLNTNNKDDAKTAFNTFQTLENVYPNYQDSRILMSEAKKKGTYKVLIQLFNDTEVIIPKRLEQDLLDFNSYGLDTAWTEFYTGNVNSSYDYVIQLSFQAIQLSPEQEKVEVFNFEKSIVDGKTELKKNGQVVKDSDGKPILVDKIITVKCKFEEFIRRKESNIVARYYVLDNKTGQPLESKTLSSSYIFANKYGRYFGDPRALNSDFIRLSSTRPLPFPSNEQMIFDSGSDLKLKFKSEIKRLKL